MGNTPEQIIRYLQKAMGEEGKSSSKPKEERSFIEKLLIPEEDSYHIKEDKPYAIKKEPPKKQVKEKPLKAEEKLPEIEVKTEVHEHDAYRIIEKIPSSTERKRTAFTLQQAREGIIYSAILGKPKGLE